MKLLPSITGLRLKTTAVDHEDAPCFRVVHETIFPEDPSTQSLRLLGRAFSPTKHGFGEPETSNIGCLDPVGIVPKPLALLPKYGGSRFPKAIIGIVPGTWYPTVLGSWTLWVIEALLI